MSGPREATPEDLRRIAENAAEYRRSMRQHVYVSTACLHDRHLDCRLHCKWCKATCLCVCHWRED